MTAPVFATTDGAGGAGFKTAAVMRSDNEADRSQS
jgi:hypothetical protein